jgi:hypothetical protein
MTKQEALQLVDRAVSMVAGSRQDHEILKQAMAVLAEEPKKD